MDRGSKGNISIFYSLADALVVANGRRTASLLQADAVAGGVQKHRVALVMAKAVLEAEPVSSTAIRFAGCGGG